MAQKSTFSTVQRTALNWGVRVGFLLMVIFVILAHLHIVEGASLFVLMGAIILLLSEQRHEAAREFQGELRSVKRDIRQLSTGLDNLAKASAPKLLSLNDCIADMSNALKNLPAGETVLIEHFGLDMTQAWKFFEPMLRDQLNLTELDYRLLILDGDVAKLDIANDEVKSWASAAEWSLKHIRNDVEAMLKSPKPNAGRIRFEARTYVAVPMVHGFRLTSPVNRCYIALCRWGGVEYRRYDWGEPQYHTILGDPSNPVSQDLLSIYDGHFRHLWNEGTRAWILGNETALLKEQ